MAHFALYRAAPSSAQDRLGIRMNSATATVRINIAIFVSFMIASFQISDGRGMGSCWREQQAGLRIGLLRFSSPPPPSESPTAESVCSDSLHSYRADVSFNGGERRCRDRYHFDS